MENFFLDIFFFSFFFIIDFAVFFLLHLLSDPDLSFLIFESSFVFPISLLLRHILLFLSVSTFLSFLYLPFLASNSPSPLDIFLLFIFLLLSLLFGVHFYLASSVSSILLYFAYFTFLSCFFFFILSSQIFPHLFQRFFFVFLFFFFFGFVSILSSLGSTVEQ